MFPAQGYWTETDYLQLPGNRLVELSNGYLEVLPMPTISLGLLQDRKLQHVAMAKMEGYTVEEIAAQQGVAPWTVQRWLRLIRRAWEEERRP